MYVSDQKKLVNIILVIIALYVANSLVSMKRPDWVYIFANAIIIPMAIFAIIVHEVSHGFAAFRLGDPTAKLAGRLTLNPMRHLDPVGMLSMILFGLGWAKPVPVDFDALKNPRRDVIIVALAGPMSNLALAAFFTLALKIYYGYIENIPIASLTPVSAGAIKVGLQAIAYGGIQINLLLMIFNLIPIPPLDGSRVVASVLPRDAAARYASIEPYGFIIIIFLIYTKLLNPVIFGPMEFIYKKLVFYAIPGLVY